MKKVRIIPRLDVKGSNVVKGIQLEGLRVVGNPSEMAKNYYEQGADELLYMDIVASLYGRNNLTDIIEETTKKGVFIPITVGGGIRSLEDITKILRSGADKVAINTAAINNPGLLKEAVQKFGASTIVLSVEAKKIGDHKWEAYTDNGREKTGQDVIVWIKKAVQLGVGEVFITSVDREGTKTGYDVDLVNAVTSVVSVPVIISGGAGELSHMEECLQNPKVDGLATAHLLHYNKYTVRAIKEKLSENFPDKIHKVWNHQQQRIPKIHRTVSVVDYGLGNLHSIRKAFEELGSTVKIVHSVDEILEAEYLVLPGVGSFEDGMNNLRSSRLDQVIVDYAHSGKFLLGICLGMQLLMTKSFEFGEHEGLDVINGEVLNFEQSNEFTNKGFKVPHVGWNRVRLNESRYDSVLGIDSDETEVYFVHSFYVQPRDRECIAATTSYMGSEFCSVVKKGNVYGCQFHPEKSGLAGLNILNEFLKLTHEEAQV